MVGLWRDYSYSTIVACGARSGKVITESSIRVAYGAHGGGAMAGLFIGLIVLENRRVHHYEVTGSRKKRGSILQNVS